MEHLPDAQTVLILPLCKFYSLFRFGALFIESLNTGFEPMLYLVDKK